MSNEHGSVLPPPQAVLAASRDLPDITVEVGTRLICEGEQQTQLLVLVAGSVAVTREGVRVARITEPGAVFGELSALLGERATATATAETPCTFRVSDRPLEFMRSAPDVALSVATLLARRLDALTRYLVDIRTQYADRDDHLGIVDVVLESLSHHQGPPPDPGSDREAEAPY